jgi:hypothetical protein
MDETNEAYKWSPPMINRSAPQIELAPSEHNAVFESAVSFGLTPHEISETAMAALDCLPEDTKSHYIDELAAALAKRVVEKQRLR